MRLDSNGKDTIEKIRLISGCNYEASKDFFESLITLIIFNHLEGKETYLPYIGSIKLVYEGDQYIGTGKEAIVSLEYKPDYNIKKIIGQIVDGEETELRKILNKKFKIELESKLE